MVSSVQKFAQTLTEKCLRINKAFTKFTISLCPNGSGNRNNHFVLIPLGFKVPLSHLYA